MDKRNPTVYSPSLLPNYSRVCSFDSPALLTSLPLLTFPSAANKRLSIPPISLRRENDSEPITFSLPKDREDLRVLLKEKGVRALIQSESGFESFRTYLVTSQAEENLDFWKRVCDLLLWECPSDNFLFSLKSYCARDEFKVSDLTVWSG